MSFFYHNKWGRTKFFLNFDRLRGYAKNKEDMVLRVEESSAKSCPEIGIVILVLEACTVLSVHGTGAHLAILCCVAR